MYMLLLASVHLSVCMCSARATKHILGSKRMSNLMKNFQIYFIDISSGGPKLCVKVKYECHV